LEKLLNFDPAARITVEQALAHPYLAAYHEEDDEPSHEKVFDFSFEVTDRIDEMKRRFLVLCSLFYVIIRRVFSPTAFSSSTL
jgi:mitogen-activated protein kinase 7